MEPERIEGQPPVNGPAKEEGFVERLVAKGVKIAIVESGDGNISGLLITTPTTGLFQGKVPSEIKIEEGKSDVEAVMEAHKSGRIKVSSIDGNTVRDIIAVSGPILSLVTDAQEVLEEEGGVPLEERVITPIAKVDPELSAKLTKVISETPRVGAPPTGESHFKADDFVNELSLVIADIAKKAPRGKLTESALKQLIAVAQKHEEIIRSIIRTAARSDRESERVEKQELRRDRRAERAEKHDERLAMRQDRVEGRELLMDLMIDWIEAHENKLDRLDLHDIREALGQIFDPAAVTAKYFERLGRPETEAPKIPDLPKDKPSEMPPAL